MEVRDTLENLDAVCEDLQETVVAHLLSGGLHVLVARLDVVVHLVIQGGDVSVERSWQHGR